MSTTAYIIVTPSAFDMQGGDNPIRIGFYHQIWTAWEYADLYPVGGPPESDNEFSVNPDIEQLANNIAAAFLAAYGPSGSSYQFPATATVSAQDDSFVVTISITDTLEYPQLNIYPDDYTPPRGVVLSLTISSSLHLKYLMSFNSRKYGILYDLKIFDQNYYDAPIEVNGGSSSVVMRKDNEGIFRGTSLDITFECPTTLPWGYSDLFNFSEQQYRVELYKLGNLVFKGFLVPEEYNDELVSPPFDVQLRAVDGIGFLKVFSLPELSTISNYTLMYVIATCLDAIGTDLDIAVALNIHESAHTTAQSALSQTYLKSSAAFKGKDLKCEELLSLILQSFDKDIILTQAYGKWVIARRFDLLQNSFYVYDKTGAFISIQTLLNTVTLASSDNYDRGYCFPVDSSMQRSIINAPRLITIEQDYGLLENAIVWGDVTNDVQTIEGEKYSKIWHSGLDFAPRFLVDGNAFVGFENGLTYSHNKPIAVQATTIDCKLVMRIYPGNGPTDIKVKVTLGAYTLTSTGWTTTPWPIDYLTLTVSGEVGTFNDYTIILDGFPISGNLNIVITTQLASPPEPIFMREIALQFYDADGNDLPSGHTSTLVTDSYSRSTDSVSVWGDVPASANVNTFYNNCFLLSTAEATQQWKMANDSAYQSLLQVLARSVAASTRKNRQRISGTIMGEEIDIHSIVYFPSNGNRYFTIESANHDLRADEMSVEKMDELLSFFETEITLSSSIEFNSAGKTASANETSDYITFENPSQIVGLRIYDLPLATDITDKFIVIDKNGQSSAERYPIASLPSGGGLTQEQEELIAQIPDVAQTAGEAAELAANAMPKVNGNENEILVVGPNGTAKSFGVDVRFLLQRR